MNENWDVGLNFFVGNYDVVGVVNKRTIKGVTFDFDRIFKRDERISPFLEFGTGIVDQYRPGFGVARKEVVAKFGGGVLADMYTFGNGNKLQAKFDAVARTSIGRQITDIVATLGVQLAIGGTQAPPPAKPAPPPPPPPPPPSGCAAGSAATTSATATAGCAAGSSASPASG